MGLSKSKTKTTNAPWAPAAPHILKGMELASSVSDQQQPALNQFSADQRATYGRVAPGAEQGILGAQGVVNSTLAGDNLNGNPYLDAMLAATRGNTTNAVASQFSRAGRYGSGNHAGILAAELAKAENGMRFQNYGMERQNQLQAVQQASGLMGGSQSLLNNAAELPWIGVGALNGNIRQASNGYGTQTGTQTQAWGPILAQAAANAGQAMAASDRRLKTNIVKVGEEADGLGIYDFDYRQDMGVVLSTERQRGVMADEVAALRPHALGPVLDGGWATVNYSVLGVGQ